MVLKSILVISIFISISSLGIFCNNPETNEKNKNLIDTTIVKQQKVAELTFEIIPNNKNEFKLGEKPLIKVNQKNDLQFDSIQFLFNKKEISTTINLPFEIKITAKIEKVGHSDIEAYIFKGGISTIQKFSIVFLSDIEPKTYSYEVLKVYPHDKNAYTQGLIFDNGFLYEATGLKGESSLRKVQLSTGDPIQSYTIDPKVFGEGITLFNDKIIQLSWQNNTGFVYDKKSFQLLSKFNYPTEGWGITNDGKSLIMSDGTNKLYYLETGSYSATGYIEVYDNKGSVTELNELEYINGEIYANIYRTDKIATIDPKTGKVLAYIDLSKILPSTDYEPDTDVLNGIAWDNSGKRLFVTGKKWPKLFEIKLR